MPVLIRTILVICLLATPALAAEDTVEISSNHVTERDRLWENYTREAAVVGSGKLRLEARALMINKLSHDNSPDLTGFPFDDLEEVLAIRGTPDTVQSIDGGRFDLVGSYGLGSTAEAGFVMPVFTQSIEFVGNTPTMNDEDVGDLVIYGKFRREWKENTTLGGGLELSIPTGSERKRMGTGELAFNPYFNLRYSSGRVAIGGHIGYRMSEGEIPDVLNYSTFIVARGNEYLALRVELNGRYFKEQDFRGIDVKVPEEFNDLSVWPGIDVNVSDHITIRPQGQIHLTDDAWEYGLGIGIAVDLL